MRFVRRAFGAILVLIGLSMLLLLVSFVSTMRGRPLLDPAWMTALRRLTLALPVVVILIGIGAGIRLHARYGRAYFRRRRCLIEALVAQAGAPKSGPPRLPADWR